MLMEIDDRADVIKKKRVLRMISEENVTRSFLGWREVLPCDGEKAEVAFNLFFFFPICFSAFCLSCVACGAPALDYIVRTRQRCRALRLVMCAARRRGSGQPGVRAWW